MTRERVWGISLQLYELRSSRNWGIGDFDDLARLCEIAGSWGADFVRLTPLHAPFLADPNRCSPYEPSNRRFLNPLYIAVDRVSGFKNSPALEKTAAKLRKTDLVDYAGVARAKLQVLRQIWRKRLFVLELTGTADAYLRSSASCEWISVHARSPTPAGPYLPGTKFESSPCRFIM